MENEKSREEEGALWKNTGKAQGQMLPSYQAPLGLHTVGSAAPLFCFLRSFLPSLW